MFNPPTTSQIIAGYYDWNLVLLSYVIATLASYAALNLYSNLNQAPQNARIFWIGGCGFCLGGGIWSMHFIGMLAFNLPLLVSYDPLITVFSFTIVFIAACFAFFILSRVGFWGFRIIPGGVVMGIGIATMHYSGMAAILLKASLYYDFGLFALSILIAISASMVALWLAIIFSERVIKHQRLLKVLASLVMGVAIVGMHYTGMAATIFVPDETSFIEPKALDTTLLSYFIATTNILILGTAIIASLVSQRFAERRKAEERLNKSQKETAAIIESVVDSLITIDELGTIEVFNPAAELTFGYSASEVIGQNVKMLMPEPYFSEHDGYIDSYNKTGEAKIIGLGREVVGRRKDGSVFPLDLAVNEMKIGGQPRFVGICRDITERKKAERALQEKHEQLQKSREYLLEAKNKVEAASEAKSIFVANMSHEMRTPLNAILGYAQILERDKEIQPSQGKRIESIHQAGKQLLSLVNDVLRLSEIEAGILEFRPHDFDLGSVVQDLYAVFYSQSGQKQLDFKIEGWKADQVIGVYGDQEKLRQVLINLLDNAVKFTDSGYVLLRVTKQKGDYFLFEVIDSGSGIPKEKQASIFLAFQQGEEGINKGGTGLGLANSKSLVELMSGKLLLESELGKGSRLFFVLNLPPAKVEVRKKDSYLKSAEKLEEGYSVKALIVDDNRTNLDVLSEMLREIGVDVIGAESGPESIQKARESKPDIILMDYRMPGMNGLEAIKSIREEHDGEKIKMAIVSASSQKHHRELFLSEGVHGFLEKPVVREDLLGMLVRLLNVRFTQTEKEKFPEPEIDINAALPFEVVEKLLPRLREAAKGGNATDLTAMVAELEKHPNFKNIAHKLDQLVSTFDFDGILRLANDLEKTLKN